MTDLLTSSWLRSLSHKNQSIDLLYKSMDWVLHDKGVRVIKRVKAVTIFQISHNNNEIIVLALSLVYVIETFFINCLQHD